MISWLFFGLGLAATGGALYYLKKSIAKEFG